MFRSTTPTEELSHMARRTFAQSIALTGGTLLQQSSRRQADELRLRCAAYQAYQVSDLVPEAVKMHDDLVNAAIFAKVEAREYDELAWDLSRIDVSA